MQISVRRHSDCLPLPDGAGFPKDPCRGLHPAIFGFFYRKEREDRQDLWGAVRISRVSSWPLRA